MKKRQIPLDDMPNTAIRDLRTVHAQEFFKTLGIKTDFLSLPISEWGNTDSYMGGKEVCVCAFSK